MERNCHAPSFISPKTLRFLVRRCDIPFPSPFTTCNRERKSNITLEEPLFNSLLIHNFGGRTERIAISDHIYIFAYLISFTSVTRCLNPFTGRPSRLFKTFGCV